MNLATMYRMIANESEITKKYDDTPCILTKKIMFLFSFFTSIKRFVIAILEIYLYFISAITCTFL